MDEDLQRRAVKPGTNSPYVDHLRHQVDYAPSSSTTRTWRNSRKAREKKRSIDRGPKFKLETMCKAMEETAERRRKRQIS